MQLDKLREWLKNFKAEGYKASEITILSFRPDNLSVADRLKNSGYRLSHAWQHGDLTSYASVHAFKGMENKVVILTDVMLDNLDFHRDMFYTGMTRATESVRVLCHRNSKPTLCEWLAGKE
jgi:superfamily I DNA/RNA helicase